MSLAMQKPTQRLSRDGSPSEFDMIARHFTRPARHTGVMLGVGDDCTLLAPTPGHQLAVSVDTSVAEVHFPHAAPAAAIGHRALAVSLSDLAAMGATPRWCLMALTLDDADDAWLEPFAQGFDTLCARAGIDQVGGDVTLDGTVTVQLINGFSPQNADSFDMLDFASFSGSPIFDFDLAPLDGSSPIIEQ